MENERKAESMKPIFKVVRPEKPKTKEEWNAQVAKDLREITSPK